MQRWSEKSKEFLITWLSIIWFSYVCTKRLDFLQICNDSILINRFEIDSYRQFVDLEMKSFFQLNDKLIFWFYEDDREIKHLRHDRTKMIDESSIYDMIESKMIEHEELWMRQLNFREDEDLDLRWISIDELINEFLRNWNFYIMRWIFHLNLTDRDNNSFYSSVNKIRQLWARLAFDFSSQALLLIDCLCLHFLSSKKMFFYIFTNVILKKLDDWDEWMLIIETMIKRSDVQKYVNSITVESTESVKSSIFTFFTIKLDAIKSNDLSIDQQRDLAILRKNHKKTLRTYRERIEAFKNLNLFILTSMNRFNLLYLRDQITIFQKLLVLRKYFAFTNRIRKLKIIRKYKNL
jgi:hypothetical protein